MNRVFYRQMYVSHVWNPFLRQPEPGKVFQICNLIYRMEYIWLGAGAFSERGVFENAMYRSEDVPVLTMYRYEWLRYWLPNLCSACFKCMLETIISWQSIPDMQYYLLQYNRYAEGRGHFRNGECLGTQCTVPRMPPFSWCTSMNCSIIDY